MKRRSFLKAGGAAAALLATSCGSGARELPQGGGGKILAQANQKILGRSGSDEEILAQAKDLITKYRQGDGVVTVRGVDGTPIPGATVKVEQLRHDFLFGCNAFMLDQIGDAQREQDYRSRFAALFNYATLGFYWSTYESQRGSPNYDYTDNAFEWCQTQGITCKGHPLAWDHPAGSPAWLTYDLAEVAQLSTSRVRDIVTRFKGRIDLWDVVNEPTDLTRFKTPMNAWAQSLGSTSYASVHLDVARQANPQAALIVNDYRVDSAFRDILQTLCVGGNPPFDAIGIQSHMHGGVWPLQDVWSVCDRFANLSLPVHFTETTVVSGPYIGPGENWGATTPELEAKQAEYVASFYTTLFAHPAAQALSWWDFSDDGAWQGAPAGLLRADMSPKPAYDRLQELIKSEWWTKNQGSTDARGEFATRAFFGRHLVTAEIPGGPTVTKEVHWEDGTANRFELTLV